MRRMYLWLMPFLFVLQGCAPKPVYRMKPKGKQITFDEGTGYIHQQKGGIDFTISYYRHFGKRFAMDVQVVNNTDSVMRVMPRQFSYEAIGDYKGEIPGDSAEVLATRQAINPENEILKKDLAISRSVAHQKTSTLIYGIGGALLIAGSAISDSTQYQRDQSAYEISQYAADQQISNHNRALKRRGLRGQRKLWQQQTIRTTDLFPGDYIEGYVFFKNEPDATGYNFYYAEGNREFKVFFSQLKFHP